MTEPSEDFAALFEASTKAKRLERGQLVHGRVVGLGADVAFVDVGGKGEATIDLAELKDADGRVEVSVGDRVDAIVVSTSGGVTLSRRLARSAATDRLLEEARHSGLPVEGKVDRAVKGGFDVRIGGHRAFCPASQIDLDRADPATHLGRVYDFRVIEYKDGGRTIVVSRRAMLEEKRREESAALRASIVPGAIVTGRVVSVRPFGAFVDLGAGVQGLLHVSEMGWGRVADPATIVTPGQEVTVRVLRVDDDRQKISLGLKQLTADPWSTVAERYAIGQVRTGRVSRVTPFGAFVELEPGVEALARDAADRLRPNTSATVEITTLDVEKKRIGVDLKPDAASVDVGDYEQPGSSGSLSSSLADKLRDALKPRSQ